VCLQVVYRLRVAACNQRGTGSFSVPSESFEPMTKVEYMKMMRDKELKAMAASAKKS
jgi:hypothetical protein